MILQNTPKIENKLKENTPNTKVNENTQKHIKQNKNK